MTEQDRNHTSYAEASGKLLSWWREGIPLVSAMNAGIESLDKGGLLLSAPLAPNRNHMGTGFGGSLQALATLAGWGISILSLPSGVSADVMIRRADMEFFKPVEGMLRAHCPWPDGDSMARFRDSLARKQRARLDLVITLPGDDGPVAACKSRFVAITKNR